MKFKLNKTTDYETFYNQCQEIINKTLKELNEFLKPFGFMAEYVNDYFDEEDGEHNNEWVGAFCSDIQSDVRIFPIAINIPLIFKYMEKKGDIDWDEVQYHIELTMAHECGHGIVNYLSDFTDEFKNKDEEDLVEQFGAYYIGDTSYSELLDMLDNFLNEAETEDEKL